MKILVLNPNTSAAMTDSVVARVRQLAGHSAQVLGATATFGFEVIASRAAFAVAGHAVLDTWARERERADAVMVACFGDPGVAALRELARVPTVGLAECSIRAALRRPGRFAIVTAGSAWKSMLAELVATMGASSRLAEIVVLEGSGLDYVNDPAGAAQRLRAEVDDALSRGADSVILGGAGFARIASNWAPQPEIIDCVAASTLELLDLPVNASSAPIGAYAQCVGLHHDLAARIEGA